MDTARQIVRWSVPGWCFFILLFLFLAIGTAVPELLSGHGSTLTVSSFLGFIPTSFLSPTLAVILGFAGIPFGYLIYQIYFWRYWKGVPTPWGLIFVSIDKGAKVLSGIKFASFELPNAFHKKLAYIPSIEFFSIAESRFGGIPFIRYFVPSFNFISRTAMMDENHVAITDAELAYRLEHNWAYALALWYRIVVPPSQAIDHQVAYMFDIYHSQGAVAAGTVLAWILAVGYEIVVQSIDLIKIGNGIGGLYLALSGTTLAFIVILKLVSSVRGSVFWQIIVLMQSAFELRNARTQVQ